MTQDQIIDTTASPVVPPATGLVAFELKVSATPLVITFDANALNAAVDAVLENYEGLEIEEGDIAAIKSEMAGLNKIKERIESARKDIAGKISQPVKEFEAQVKAAAQRIIEVRAKLDAQVKAFEEKQRQARRDGVQKIINEVLTSAELAGFTVPIDDRWLNKSITAKAILAEVESIVLKEKAARLQAEQLERAKQDRMTWLEQAVKAACTRYGFELPLARFSTFLDLATSMEEAQKAINVAFLDEQARQNWAAMQRTAPAPVPPPMPTADDDAMPTFDDDDAMPTVEGAAAVTGAQAAPVRRVMHISISYQTTDFHDLMRQLDEIRQFAIVTINGNR